MPRRPEIIASACGAGAWPANTLEAARRCLDTTLDGLEIDVQQTRDGAVVLNHDFHFSPDAARLDGEWLSGPSAPIRDMTLETVRAFDVGSRRPGSKLRADYPDREQWNGIHVPTLAEIWDALASRSDRVRTLIIEIKTSPQEPGQSPNPELLTDAVLNLLKREATPAIRPRIIAFDWRVLRRCRERAPHILTGHLVVPKALEHEVTPDSAGRSPWTDGCDPIDHGGSVVRAVAAHGGAQISVYHRDITPALMAEARLAGISVAAWGLVGPADLAEAYARDVDSLTISGPRWRVDEPR